MLASPPDNASADEGDHKATTHEEPIRSFISPLYCLTVGLKSWKEAHRLLHRRYRQQECLGEGSFSQIFKAVDVFTGMSVAVKMLNPGYNQIGQSV